MAFTITDVMQTYDCYDGNTINLKLKTHDNKACVDFLQYVRQFGGRYIDSIVFNSSDNQQLESKACGFEVKKVIYNCPATIVLWKDGTKTVVKCQEKDTYDPEKGIALCFMKKALGNKGAYNNVFHKHAPEEIDLSDVSWTSTLESVADFINSFGKSGT